jgi:DNA-binding phage protein
MPSTKPTAYDRFVAKKLRSPAFAAAYASERAEIDAIDAVIRAVEDARIDIGMSKAELARRIAASPESVRRLLTAERVNPTFRTTFRLLHAVGLAFAIVSEHQAQPGQHAPQQARRKSAARVLVDA